MKKVILTMVLLFLVGCDKNVEMTEPVATVEAFVESEAKAGRIRLIAKYENGEFVDGDYEIVVSK